jgi:4-oxalocrotonate tautomerase
MPVTVHLWEGRTVDQKRALVRAITDAMVEHADASRDGLHVWVEEYSRESWARNGVLAVDMETHDVAERPSVVWRLDHALLEVSDLPTAEAFYVDVLGFGIRKRDVLADGRPLTVTEQGLGLAGGRSVSSGPVKLLSFRARNLRALARVLEDSNAEMLSGVETTEAGLTLRIKDFDGNEIEFFEHR